MRATRKAVTEIRMDDEELVIHTPRHEEAGPFGTVTINRYGIVTYKCEYREVTVAAIDPGPGGIQIFVEGKHEDGSP